MSCIALHVNFVCVGTYNGNVLLLELNGKFIRRLHQHYKKVNDVCIDETGQVRNRGVQSNGRRRISLTF